MLVVTAPTGVRVPDPIGIVHRSEASNPDGHRTPSHAGRRPNRAAGMERTCPPARIHAGRDRNSTEEHTVKRTPLILGLAALAAAGASTLGGPIRLVDAAPVTVAFA